MLIGYMCKGLAPKKKHLILPPLFSFRNKICLNTLLRLQTANKRDCFSWRLSLSLSTINVLLRARRIGANPEKSDLVNSGVRTEENLVNSVLCCFFLGKTDKMLPKSRFSKLIFGHSAGSTELDRPYCKRF